MLQQGLPDTPMEDVTMQRNLIHSEMIHSDTVVPMRAKKGRNRKRKSKWKRRTAPAKVDLIQQPTDGTCLVTDSRLVQRDVEFGDCGDIQQTSFNKSSLSNDINISRDSHLVDNKNTVEVNVNQLPGANVNPVSMVVEHTDQVCTNNASQEVGLGSPLAKEKKKRKKGRKNLNALTSNDVQYDSQVAPSIHNSSLENESIQQASTSTSLVADSEVMLHCAEIGLPVESLKEMHLSAYESNGNISCVEGRHVATDLTSIQEANTNSISKVVESDHQACTGNISISQGLNLGVLHTKRKKRKGRGKNQISLTNNGELHDNLTCLSLARENPLYNDSIQQPVVDICIMTDSEVVQQGAKLGQCDDTQKGIYYNSAESNDSNKGSRDIHMKMNAKSTPESNANPIHKVTKDDDPACADNVSEKMGMTPLQPKKTKRKKKKKNPNALISKVIMPSACLMTDSELMQHNAEQGIPKDIHQNACATKDKSCSGKDSPGIIDNQNNSEVNTISVSQGKGLVNMQENKKRKRKSPWKALNPESKEGVISSIDLSGEQQVKRNKLNADQNAGIGRTLTGGIKKKLLVVDLNGLLADIVGDKIRDFKPDGIVAGKKIFKRPFCEDFLQFCFERFTVGVWSSRKKKNVDMVIKVTMGGKNRSKLAFIWNQFQCTRTGFQTIENTKKPLFLKKLSQLWNNKNGRLPWNVGDYDESNTLLLDDSPYKALQNPPYTAIFPNPYQYQDQNDNALGPGGVLRVYLEGLALAEDVQEYVKQNPFGQKPITESDPNWSFYAKVISSGSKGQLKGTTKRDKEINTQINSNPSLNIRVAPPQNQNTVEDSSTKDMPSNFLNLLRMHQLKMQSRTI